MTIVLNHINNELSKRGLKKLVASQGTKLPYAFEILSYSDNTPTQTSNIAYETDILVFERFGSKEWNPGS